MATPDVMQAEKNFHFIDHPKGILFNFIISIIKFWFFIIKFWFLFLFVNLETFNCSNLEVYSFLWCFEASLYMGLVNWRWLWFLWIVCMCMYNCRRKCETQRDDNWEKDWFAGELDWKCNLSYFRFYFCFDLWLYI